MTSIKRGLARALPAAAVTFAMMACSETATAPITANPATPRYTVTPSYIIDTGPGSNTTTIGSPVVFRNTLHWEDLGGKFTLATSTDVQSLEAWLYVAVAGTVDVHIRADSSGLPGADIHSQQYSLPSSVYAWNVFSAYNVTLAAGTYWVTLEPPAGSTLNANWVNGASTPLPAYGYFADGNISWHTVTASGGFRLYGAPTPPPPNPGAMITVLTDYVDNAGLATPIQKKLDGSLSKAAAAVTASNTANACAYMQDVIDYTNKQGARKIPTSVSTEILSEANAIRSALGC